MGAADQTDRDVNKQIKATSLHFAKYLTNLPPAPPPPPPLCRQWCLLGGCVSSTGALNISIHVPDTPIRVLVQGSDNFKLASIAGDDS